MVKKWMSVVLKLAGIYNIVWGTWVVLFPHMAFEISGAQIPNYLEIWQCVGMIVAVYGLGYWLAANNPLRHWPIVLVGFLGKIFGPIGFVFAIIKGTFPLVFGWNIIFNDLIWWIPFALILNQAWIKYRVTDLSELLSFDSQKISELPDRYRVHLINSLSGFKSVNLVGTIDNKSRTNLSMVSSFFHLGANPALIGFIIRPDLARRDTLENLRDNGLFTINHVHQEILVEGHHTSARFPPEVSEFDACELDVEYRDQFLAPFIAKSRVKMAAQLVREVKIEENGAHLMIAKIVRIYVPKTCLEEDGHLDLNKAGSVCASGLDTYSEATLIGRLEYAKPHKKPSWL